jgi:hypothetical protein
VRSRGTRRLHEATEPTERTCHLSVTLPKNLYDALISMAADHERSISGEIRWVIREKADESGLLGMWDAS